MECSTTKESGYKMKVKFVFDKKAQDGDITLRHVSFNTSRFLDVVKAFRTFGEDEIVNNMVKLISRTNQHMLFNITGPESKLKDFFSKFYNHMEWKEIKAKYYKTEEELEVETKKRDTIETKGAGTTEDLLLEGMKKAMIKLGYKFGELTFDKDEKTFTITDYKSDKGDLSTKLPLQVAKFLKGFNYEIKGPNIKNPAKIKIILKEL